MDLSELQRNLGERIVDAARLAVAMHVCQEKQDRLCACQEDELGQRIGIGGTGSVSASEARWITPAPEIASSNGRR